MKVPPASEFCTLGGLWARAGNLASAEEALRAGLPREPYSYMCHRELGEIDRVKGRLAAAQENLEFVVRFYPEADSGTYHRWLSYIHHRSIPIGLAKSSRKAGQSFRTLRQFHVCFLISRGLLR